MKNVALLHKLRELGAVFVRHGAHHDVFVQPKTNKEAAVPRHNEINEYMAKSILDLFANPVGYRTSLAECRNFFQKSPYSAVFSGSCSKTEVSEQLY